MTPGEQALRREIKAAADWVRDTCLAFGVDYYTAYKCAGAFADGLANDPKVEPWRSRVLGGHSVTPSFVGMPS